MNKEGDKISKLSIINKFFNQSLTKTEKIKPVRDHKDEYSINRVLKALKLSKKTWYYAQQRQAYEKKYHHLRKPLLEIAKAHPEYGYRRTTAELRDRGFHINRKVVERLHSFWDLAVIKRVRHPKESSIRKLLKESGSKINLVKAIEGISDFEGIYTDFTEISYQRGKAKPQFMPIIDHSSKLVVGHALGEISNTELALEDWKKARFGLKG